MTEYPLGKGVCFWELKMYSLYMATTSTECPLRKGVCFWELKVYSLHVAGNLAECPLRRSVSSTCQDYCPTGAVC